MSSDSELDEFFDAEDSTPARPKLNTVNESLEHLDELEREEKRLLELKRQQEERRKKEDEELQKRLQALQMKKREEKGKKTEISKKDKLEIRRKKHEELRRKMAFKKEDSNDGYSSAEDSDVDTVDGPKGDNSCVKATNKGDNISVKSTHSASVGDSDHSRDNAGDSYEDLSVNINSAFPEKEKPNKQMCDFVSDTTGKMDTLDHNFIDVDNIVENVLQETHLLNDENEPDIVKSTKTRTPPNTLQGTASGQMSELSATGVHTTTEDKETKPDPVAPPRRKKKLKVKVTMDEPEDQSISSSQRSSISSLPNEPQSPGLPPERLLMPTGIADEMLSKDIAHSLDLRSIIRGRKHINAEDAEITAVNSDHDSPLQTLEAAGGGRMSKTSSLDRSSVDSRLSKTASLDRESKKSSKSTSLESRRSSKSSSLEKEEKRKSRHNSGQPETSSRKESFKRPRAVSRKDLTDEEILASVIVKNLDTGEAIPLKDAENKIQKCMDPLVLHIMERTKEYQSEDMMMSDADDDDTISVSGRSMLAEKSLKKKGAKLKKLLGKKVGQTVNKMKSVADQVMHNEENTTVVEEGLSDDARRFKFKANHNKKGPWDFGQLQHIQDLSGEHTGAIWSMKFSPCGRLLATGGQDSVLRIWVLQSAYNYFDDMRQKYVEMKVSPAPSQESLSSIPSSSSEISGPDMGATADKDDEKTGPFKNKPFCTYRGHTADLLDISWSKNYFILSSSMDKTVRLWHISRRECLCTFQHIDFVTAIVFHPKDDRYFLSGSLDGKLRLWNIPDKKVTLWNEAGNGILITTANFCHNGKFAVVGTYDGKCIFYSTEHLKYYTQIHVRSTRGRNSQGRKITGIEPLPGEDKVLVTSNDSRVRLYDLRDLTLTCKYKGPTNTSSQIKASFSPYGKYVICGSEDHFTYMWRTQHEFYKFSSARRDRNDYYEAAKVHNAVVTSAVFAPAPSHFLNSEDPTNPPIKPSKDRGATSDIDCEAEFIISADFLGSIKVIRAK